MRTLCFAMALVCACNSSSPKTETGKAPLEDARVTSPDLQVMDARAKDAQTDRRLAPDGGGPLSLKVLAQYTDVAHGLLVLKNNIYAVDSKTNTVWVFDAMTAQKIVQIPVGPAPLRLATDGSYVFALNGTAREESDPYLSIIDPAKNAVVQQLFVSEKAEGSDPLNYPWTNFPWDLSVLDGKLYVVFPTNKALNVMPIGIGSPWKEGAFFAAGSGPQDLAGAGGRLVLTLGRVMLNADDDAVAVFKTDGSLLKTFETSGRLHAALAVGGKVWVARAPKTGAGEVIIVDPVALSTTSVAVGAGAYGLAAHNGRVYVTCPTANQIDVIDVATQKVVETIALGAYTPAVVNARGIAITASGDIVIEADNLIALLPRKQP